MPSRLRARGGPSRVAAALVAVLFAAAACSDSGSALPSQGPRASTPAGTGGAAPSSAPTVAPASGPAATPAPPATLPASGTWARLEVDGRAPTAREDHTWTVAEDGVAYLFGGRDGGTAFDDLWAFDPGGQQWSEVAVGGDGPSARFGHEAAWIAGLGLAVWAGQAGSAFFDDLWLFDPAAATWERMPADGLVPVPRYGSCSGVGPDGRLWISHGFTEDGARFADTKAYDFTTRAWIDQAPPGTGPVERCLHACWWTSDGRFALYGGQTTGVAALGDLWFLTPGEGGAPSNTWAEAPAPEPAARQLAAVAHAGAFAVLTGGRGLDGKALADTWLLADGEAAFVRLEEAGAAGPARRSGAALVHDAAGERLLLFGGQGDDAYDDLWTLTLP